MTHWNTVHGLRYHPLYQVWISMRKRCYKPRNQAYKWYGAKGIKVCSEWKDDIVAFYNWAIANGWKKGLQIDRIDNSGNYEPSNCRFITSQKNIRNQGIKKTNTSGYIGVSRSKSCGKNCWVTQIKMNYKIIWIGNYATKKEAAIARDNFIINNELDHKLNFPNRRFKLMAKGGAFARDMAKEFSLYLTQMKTEDGVWLTESSGGRATSKLKAKQHIRSDQFGDITYTIPECKYWFDIFSIECKTGYAKKTKGKKHVTLTHWSLMDMIDSHQQVSQFHEFWEQCLNDAIESKREPLLVFRRNRRTPCIAMHEDIFIAFTRRFGSPDFNYIILTTLFDPISIVTMNLRHFFDWTQQINESIFLQIVTRPLMKRR